MMDKEYDRIEQLEDLVRIIEEKNEDDNAALAREIVRLWDAIHRINELIQEKS
jgi:hypothetical protein